jgi:hypothetical protein
MRLRSLVKVSLYTMVRGRDQEWLFVATSANSVGCPECSMSFDTSVGGLYQSRVVTKAGRLE